MKDLDQKGYLVNRGLGYPNGWDRSLQNSCWCTRGEMRVSKGTMISNPILSLGKACRERLSCSIGVELWNSPLVTHEFSLEGE